jgi:hypothetical protein
VKLLKEDASVLSYFRSLQANLQADVDVWKDRAQTWEHRVKTLQAKLRKQQNELKQQSTTTNSAPTAAKRRRHSSTDDDLVDSDDFSSIEGIGLQVEKNRKASGSKKISKRKTASKSPFPVNASRHIRLVEGAKEITEDDLLLLSNSSSNYESSDNDEIIGDTTETKPTVVQKNGTSKKASLSKLAAENPQRSTEAATSKVGEGQTQQTEIDSQSESESKGSNYQPDYSQQAEKVPPKTRQYFLQVANALESLGLRLVDEEKKWRSNETVCTDIKVTMGWLCRNAYSKEAMLGDHPPFPNQLPATADDHLARQGFRTVVQAVFLLDTFSEQWTNTDFRDREEMLSVLEKRLIDEILYEGPHRDRALRFTESTSFFCPKDDVRDEASCVDNAAGAATHVSAKSLAKLLDLLERMSWAEFLIGIQLSRNDIPAVVRIVRDYILFTIPSLGQEDNVHHPRVAPTLSFVVLEAMMTTDLKKIGWESAVGKSKNDYAAIMGAMVWGDVSTNTTPNVYAMSLRHAADIWQERAKSTGDAVSHVAQLELTAYERLCRKCCLGVLTCNSENLHKLDNVAHNLISPSDIVTYQLLLVFKGSCIVSISKLTWKQEKDREWNLNRIYCWFVAIRQMVLRRLSETKAAVGTPAALKNNSPTKSLIGNCRRQIEALWRTNPFRDNVDKALVLATLLKSAALLADGDSVLFYGDQLITLLETLIPADYENNYKKSLLVPAWEILRNVSKRPLARVINLQRRPDRWEFMLYKAMQQEILIIRGVERLFTERSIKSGSSAIKSSSTNFNFAFDGKWSRDQLLEHVGNPLQLAKLIETVWYPVRLAPFDRDAPKNDAPVCMHDSEVACAVSHIASWRTCNLLLQEISHLQQSSCGLIRQPTALRHAFQIAGYARGAPLHWKNRAMPPTPVCLILEDDAYLENGFHEKLDALLKQLPRDFHYCALGYSRPKSAPILSPWPSRPRVGIPTHLFFATGYLVSQTGLDYLKEKGPVRGPVDVWLGLLQTSNFENMVGQRLGVGSHGKGGTLNSSTAATLMNFMAYCAVPVLCRQPLAKGHHHLTGEGRRWKEKDTDIVYSGHPSS